MISEEDKMGLCSRIKFAVMLLNEAGFTTTDSGDGSHFKDGMEGAMEVPMIAVRTNRDDMFTDADRVIRLLLRWEMADGVMVEATYLAPGASYIILCSGPGLARYLWVTSSADEQDEEMEAILTLEEALAENASLAQRLEECECALEAQTSQ